MCCPGSVMAIVTTGEDGRIFFLNRRNMSVKMADESSKIGSLPKQSQWNRSAKPMESFSKINGIAERFHWNGLTKPPVYLSKSSTFACRNRCCCPHTLPAPRAPISTSHYKHRLFPLSLVTCRRFASFPLPRPFRGERSVQAPRRADIRGVSAHPPQFSQGGCKGLSHVTAKAFSRTCTC